MASLLGARRSVAPEQETEGARRSEGWEVEWGLAPPSASRWEPAWEVVGWVPASLSAPELAVERGPE